MTPFASELVVWRRQLAKIRALADPRCKNRAKQAARTPTNLSKTPKSKEKPAWKVPRRDPALKKSARAVCEAAKTQGNIMDERRAPPKTGDGPQKKTREEKRTTSYTNDAKKHSWFPENQRIGPRHKKNTKKPNPC